MSKLVKMLLPHGEIVAGQREPVARLTNLAGKRIGIVDNALWRSMHILADELAMVLPRAYGVAAVETITVLDGMPQEAPAEYRALLEDLSQRVDAAVAGLGN
jgi:hypothetical protein